MMKKINHNRLHWLAALLGMLIMPLSILAAEGGIDWNQLSVDEQKVLQPFADRWQELNPQQQQRLQKGAGRWATLTPDQRQRVKERLKNWKQDTNP